MNRSKPLHRCAPAAFLAFFLLAGFTADRPASAQQMEQDGDFAIVYDTELSLDDRDDTRVLLAVAAGGNARTGRANGVASMQILEKGRTPRLSQIHMEMLNNKYEFNRRGRVVGYLLFGIATVASTDGEFFEAHVLIQRNRRRFVILITDGIPNSRQEWFRYSIPVPDTWQRDVFPVRGPISNAVAIAAFRFNDNGGIDTLTAAAVSPARRGAGAIGGFQMTVTDPPDADGSTNTSLIRGRIFLSNIGDTGDDSASAALMLGRAIVRSDNEVCTSPFVLGVFAPAQSFAPGFAGIWTPRCADAGRDFADWFVVLNPGTYDE